MAVESGLHSDCNRVSTCLHKNETELAVRAEYCDFAEVG